MSIAAAVHSHGRGRRGTVGAVVGRRYGAVFNADLSGTSFCVSPAVAHGLTLRFNPAIAKGADPCVDLPPRDTNRLEGSLVGERGDRMELLEALESSFREFDRRLDTVEPTQWTLDTPCEGWTVCDLVDHVWFGCMAYLRFFEGSSYRQVLADRPPTLTPAVAAEKYRAAAALVTLLRAPGSLEREVHYSTRTHTTGADLLVFRMWDNLMHAWDLAQGLHLDDHLDDELVALSYELILPHLDMYRDGGHLADPQPLHSDNTTTQARLLRLSGRAG